MQILAQEQERTLDALLEEVYSLAKHNDLDTATDRIFDFIDRLLSDGSFPVCDELLRRIEVDHLPPALMRSFLAITVAAKDRLPSWKELYRNIEQKMVELKGPAKTQRLIGQLA
jgi:hypothetical protein